MKLELNADEAIEQCISIGEAVQKLGINRSTMYYYRQLFNIEHKRFPLDKRTYISIPDFEKIKEARKAASQREHWE